MNIKWKNLVFKRKLIFVFLISICIQITIFILIQSSGWQSQGLYDDPWSKFLTQTIEPYTDYKYWYQSFTSQFLDKEWLPYIKLVNVFDNPEKLRPFIYPPFFFYVLILPSFISVELVFVPLLLSNILLPIVVYKLLRNTFEQKVAEWGFIATALCPLYLFYSGGMALNSSLITFFFVLSLYYISINRFSLAILFLSISILFKPMTIFFIPPILFYIVVKSISDKEKATTSNYIKKFLKYSIIVAFVLFLGSLPWILISLNNYIYSLSSYGTFRPTLTPHFGIFYGHKDVPRNWFDFLIDFDAPYEVFYVFGFLTFTYIGIILYEILVIVLLFHQHHKKSLDWKKFLDIIVYTTFLSHLFFPRGNYKYYYTFFVPIIILWICFNFSRELSENNLKRKNWFYMIVVVSISFMLMHRYYYQLLVWWIFIYIIIQNRILAKRNSNDNIINKAITVSSNDGNS